MLIGSLKKTRRIRRHKKILTRMRGTKERPRVLVYRSLKHIYVQFIDDESGHVLLSISDLHKSVQERAREQKGMNRKVALAFSVGVQAATEAIKKNINQIVFDRGGFLYHGRIQAVAEGMRKGGLKF